MKKFVFVIALLIFSININSQQNPLENPFFSPFFQSGTNHWLFSPLFDTTSVHGNWSYLTQLPVPLFGINAYYWPDSNKIFVCGGADQSAIPHSQCYFYNLTTNVYEPKAALPIGRWSGKLVRVRDSLYLVGSIDSNYTSPDGNIYKYSPSQNTWVTKARMPSPYLMESAVCVWNDSIIICVGGSTNSFLGTTTLVRTYDPFIDSWRNVPANYPMAMSTGHAECHAGDSSIVVAGGIGNGILNKIHLGKINPLPHDSITIMRWDTLAITDTLWGNPIYRVAGARWRDYMLFGPAMKDSATSNKIFGIGKGSDTIFTRFLPNTINSAGNISTIAVKTGLGNDSSFFYLFGGYLYGNVIQTAIAYSFVTPPPIGIKGNASSVPKLFNLYQNYPNPFNPVTKIKFDIPSFKGGQTGFVQLIIYDILGRQIETLANGIFKPGSYQFDFNGSNLSSGIYYYKLVVGESGSGGFSESKKMILIK